MSLSVLDTKQLGWIFPSSIQSIFIPLCIAFDLTKPQALKWVSRPRCYAIAGRLISSLKFTISVEKLDLFSTAFYTKVSAFFKSNIALKELSISENSAMFTVLGETALLRIKLPRMMQKLFLLITDSSRASYTLPLVVHDLVSSPGCELSLALFEC